MTIRQLEHYNIRTLRYADTIKFYEDGLGMQVRRSPTASEDMPPTWICDDSGAAVVHLILVDPADPGGSYAKIAGYRGGDQNATFEGSGAIDHIAFACEGFDEVKSRLNMAGITFWEDTPRALGIRQLFLKDPNGVTLELNFRA